jgi:hypothetical protein
MILRAARWSETLCVFCLGFLIAVSLHSCSPDHGLGPTVQGIRGTVYFQGAWPEDVLEVRVVVSKTYPPESFLDLSGYSDAIPLLSDSSSYEIMLASGTYAFVAVACRTSPNWDTQCLLGFYHVEGDPGTPRPVEVRSGDFTDDVDITVAFGGLRDLERAGAGDIVEVTAERKADL